MNIINNQDKMEKTKINELEINGIKYVPKDSIVENKFAEKLDDMDFCMIRCDRSGVFFGYIKSRKDKEVEVINSRRVFYWDGAASLSQLAESGTTKPENCKFPEPISRQILLDVIELDFITEKAKLILDSVPVWKR